MCDSFGSGRPPFSFFLPFSLFFFAFAYFQLFHCALIRLRARNAGRSDFARLAENDLLIAEETSSVGVLDVHAVPELFLPLKEDSYGRR